MIEVARVQREVEVLLAGIEGFGQTMPYQQASIAWSHISNMRAQAEGEKLQLQALFAPYYDLDAAIRKARLQRDSEGEDMADEPLLSTEPPCDLSQEELPAAKGKLEFVYEGQTVPFETTAYLSFEAFTDPTTGRDVLRPLISIRSTAKLNLAEFHQIARSNLPASDCNHRFKLENGGGFRVTDNVEATVPVRYEYWGCGSFDLPCIKGWTVTTCRQHIKTRLFNVQKEIAWRAWFDVVEDQIVMRGYVGIPFSDSTAVVQDRFEKRVQIDFADQIPADVYPGGKPRFSAIKLLKRGEAGFELSSNLQLNTVRPATGCYLKERLLDL